MDNFTDCWQVTEYVFTPTGRFVGEVHQQRELVRLPDGALRVVQHCRPQFSGTGNVMERFSGEFVFVLRREGRARRYEGPDVIGTGVPWGSQLILGSGIWPRFGYAFTSYGLLVSTERQLTGGRFYQGNECVAIICGVAQRGAHTRQPKLDIEAMPQDASAPWSSTTTSWRADGTPDEETTADHKQAWIQGMFAVAGWQGTGKRIGPSWECRMATPGHARELHDIFDAYAAAWLTIEHRWNDGVFSGVTVTHRAAKLVTEKIYI
jgi:hypothetical protein